MTDKQKTVLEVIYEWSQEAKRPIWQRDCLRRIFEGGTIRDEVISDLVLLCKKPYSDKEIEIEPIELTEANLPASPGSASSIRLSSISSVTGVNNLAPDQDLDFESEGLTIVYGDNGTGKSGYTRILRRACRARYAGEIESNIYATPEEETQKRADISYLMGGVEQSPITWKNAPTPNPILSAVNVFDRDSGAIHIKGKNDVAFRPFGLDIPDELADACNRVKEALVAEKQTLEQSRDHYFRSPKWSPDTSVGKILSSLSHESDIEILRTLAEISEEEILRHKRLSEDLAKDPAKAAAQQRLFADNISQIKSLVADLYSSFSDTALSELQSLFLDAQAKRKAAEIAATNAFTQSPLPGVGGDEWKVLWESARKYSNNVAYDESEFPPDSSEENCVLCQQTLSEDALKRMRGFEDFLQADTEQQARTAENLLKPDVQNFSDRRISSLSIKSQRRQLALQNSDLANKVLRYLASLRLRRCIMSQWMQRGSELNLTGFSDDPTDQLVSLESQVRQYAVELDNAADADERKKLEAELIEMTDRISLNTNLELVIEEIARLRETHTIEKAMLDTTTNSITKLGNKIADETITPQMRDRFQKEIVRLAAHKVRVEIVRSGGKYGSPQYQVRLFARPKAKVAEVLSEGEQTCVALAAFLTELATSSHSSALVFDDPVSSLDHRWRKQVAKRLVSELQFRQIIVFTHDLVFVNDLYDLAQDKKLEVKLLTVTKSSNGSGIIADGLPWKAAGVPQRIDELEKRARAAKALHDNDDETEYEDEVIAIYNRLRSSWERAIEDIAFSGVINRHRDYINAKNLKRVSVLTEQDCDEFAKGFKKCSDIIEGHDPSRGRNASVPSPNDVLADIQALNGWIGSLKDRQKRMA